MILAAVSGGLDSVAMLYKLLSEGEAVHVHHISLRNHSQRWRAEDRAMALIVPWLRGQGFTFGYSESTRMRAGASDIVVVSEECAPVAKRIAATALARGANAHDMRNVGTGARQQAAERRWRALLGESAPPIVFPVATMHRRALWEMLPLDLRVLTTSCRKPRLDAGYQACGRCQTCNQLAAEGVPLDRALSLEVAA